MLHEKKEKKRYYDYDYYSDETDIETEDEHTNIEDSDDEVIIKKHKNTSHQKAEEKT